MPDFIKKTKARLTKLKFKLDKTTNIENPSNHTSNDFEVPLDVFRFQKDPKKHASYLPSYFK